MDGFRKCTTTKVQMADRGRRKAEEEDQLIKGTMQQLIEEVRDLREAINVGQGPQRRRDETPERVSNPTPEHGSNPTLNGSIPTLDTMRGVGTNHSDHEFNEEVTNNPDVEVRMPWRGRTLFQPRTHQGAGKEVILLSTERPRDQPMAKGTIQTTDPEARVRGSLLGSECYEVVVNTVMRSDHLLPRQYGKFMTLADSLGQSIVWPHLNILTEERAAKQSEIEQLQQGDR